ncbi:NUDIX hydrolase [Patescibacteria group bacterium]
MSQPKYYIIASGPVIIENGKVLLNKHGDDNIWKFPGGKVEDFSELSLEEHAKREVKEEMGIQIEIQRPLKPMMIEKDGKLVVLIHYLATRVGEISPGPDIEEWKWISVNELPDDCAPNIKPVLESIK